MRGCIREIADFLAINIIVEPRSATYLERYVTTGKCLILSTDEALDANEAVNSYQERDDHREVVSHPEDVGGTSLAKQVISAVCFVCILAILTNSAAAGELPPPGEWTEHGVVLRPSASGWDSFTLDDFGVHGGVKKDGVYYVYYEGASGPRYDGGPANRALGVATSPDGINFTKYSGNPVITHQPSEGHVNQVEEGVITSAVALDDDGNFVLYWGALTAISSTEVKCDIHMSVSSDGFNFVDQCIVVPNTIDGGGDEVWPNGVLHTGGKWNLWYRTDGFSDEFGRKTFLVSGNTPGVLEEPFINPLHSGALGSPFFAFKRRRQHDCAARLPLANLRHHS